jgi:hypothetical protein
MPSAKVPVGKVIVWPACAPASAAVGVEPLGGGGGGGGAGGGEGGGEGGGGGGGGDCWPSRAATRASSAENSSLVGTVAGMVHSAQKCENCIFAGFLTGQKNPLLFLFVSTRPMRLIRP